jgi:hypothetical protein
MIYGLRVRERQSEMKRLQIISLKTKTREREAKQFLTTSLRLEKVKF